MQKHCPTYEHLQQVILGDGNRAADDPALRQHLRQCESCRRALDQASDDPELRTWKGALRQAETIAVDLSPALVERILSDALTSRTLKQTHRWNEACIVPLPLSWLEPGTRLGSFELLEELGRGGMAVVYKARDLELDRLIALKIIPLNNVDEKSRSRFLREAQAAARVKNDHVVTVYAADTAPDGSAYLVMELIEGYSLTSLLRGHLSCRMTADLLAQAAQGLQAIHDARLVHCDVKPSNIMIESTRAGRRAKITDFGLAQWIATERRVTLDTISGTPQYMSPEQLRGKQDLTPSTDIYSLGVTLYESLTGVVPFNGNPHAVMHQIEHVEPRPPTALNPQIPRDLETICLKAMAKEPSQRYASALEFNQDLQRWLNGEPILARPAGAVERLWRWCRRNPRVASLSAAVFLLMLFSTVVSISAAVRIAGEQTKTKREQIAAQLAERHARDQALVAERAQALAEANARQAREQRNLALDAHVNLVGGVHDRLADTPGTLALRKELLEAAVSGLQVIVGQSAETDANHTLFLAHQRLGEAYLVLGRADDARRELELAHRIAVSLSQRDPTSDNARDDLSAALTSLGEFHVKSLDYKTAQRELEQALELLDSMSARRSSDEGFQYRRIRVLNNLGDTALRLSETGTAESYFQEALKLSDQLQADNILSAQSRRVMESILRRLGDAALLRGELGKGVELYRKAVASAEEAGLAKLSFFERNGLVDAYGRLGLVLMWLGEADESELYFKKAFELNERTSLLEPDNLQLQRKAAVFFQRFADLSWSRGDYEAMRAHLQKALDIHQQLLARDTTSQQSQNDVVICLEQFARLETRLERYPESASWYEQMLGILRARKQAGTLNDPVSLNFEQTSELALEVLAHLPAAIDASQLSEGAKPVIQSAILLERATVRARRGDALAAEESLAQAASVIATLSTVEQTALQLVIARIHGLCASAIQKDRPLESLTAVERTRLSQHKSADVKAMGQYYSASPFNATYLGFESELRSLRDHAGFQKLLARFRGGK